jgi:hypothetical protein
MTDGNIVRLTVEIDRYACGFSDLSPENIRDWVRKILDEDFWRITVELDNKETP